MCAVFLTVTSCHSDDEADAPAPAMETVQLIVSVPETATRAGDPGTAVDEGTDWDRMSVILAYTDDSQVTLPGGSKVRVVTITKDYFETLPVYNTNFRLLTIDALPGIVYIYGVTYSDGAADGPAADIKGCMNNAAVQNLAISNDYASDGTTIDYAKFVSVATGYYKGDDGNLSVFEIKEGGTGQVGVIPTMTLTRLAAKIDIQWDAADAYEAGYTDVKVTDFTYNGAGQGRLFPELSPATATTPKAWTFYNSSAISQRNGREYHYTFPDGKSVPSLTFNISANGLTTSKNYEMKFTTPLQRATWYKVNAFIKGVNGSGTITLSQDGQAGG